VLAFVLGHVAGEPLAGRAPPRSLGATDEEVHRPYPAGRDGALAAHHGAAALGVERGVSVESHETLGMDDVQRLAVPTSREAAP
jgi:hypothetical protein